MLVHRSLMVILALLLVDGNGAAAAVLAPSAKPAVTWGGEALALEPWVSAHRILGATAAELRHDWGARILAPDESIAAPGQILFSKRRRPRASTASPAKPP